MGLLSLHVDAKPRLVDVGDYSWAKNIYVDRDNNESMRWEIGVVTEVQPCGSCLLAYKHDHMRSTSMPAAMYCQPASTDQRDARQMILIVQK